MGQYFTLKIMLCALISLFLVSCKIKYALQPRRIEGVMTFETKIKWQKIIKNEAITRANMTRTKVFFEYAKMPICVLFVVTLLKICTR